MFSWPDCVSVADLSISACLADDDDAYSVWPGDAPIEQLVVGEDLLVVGGQLLVTVCDAEASDDVIALVSLDAATLTASGLVRPPCLRMDQLRQRGENRFVVQRRSGHRAVALVAT